jgi:methionyl-tRNA formyltransferase
MFANILFFGRENCKYSLRISNFLKKNSKKLIFIKSKKRNEFINLKKINNQKFEFIFCFRSFYILKKKLIDQSKFGAINFHPGTPKYRGIGAVNFAIYQKSKSYGSTAHFINEKIDNGKIIDVCEFKINKSHNIEKILNKTYLLMFKQAIRVFKNILQNKNYYLSKKKTKFKWSKKLYTSSDLNKLYEINLSKCKLDLTKLLNATYTKKFKPFIKIKNTKYFLVNSNENLK